GRADSILNKLTLSSSSLVDFHFRGQTEPGVEQCVEKPKETCAASETTTEEETGDKTANGVATISTQHDPETEAMSQQEESNSAVS
uniref:Si:dkeyp-72h1.1 n=1 Tax=Macrostomum lignano TaxID=282301 RepID=A0A1I8HMA7_9PLAT